MPDKLLNFLSANAGTKIISIVIAIVLWVVVLGSRNVEVTKEVPLEIITPADVVPSNDIPERIAFRLSGPKAFLRAILDRREDPIRVNLAGAKPGVVTYRFFSDNIRLPIGVKVLSINPAAIVVKLEYVKRRDVPVRADLRGVPPDGYRISKTEIKPGIVRIRGAASKIDSITEILSTPIDISDVKNMVEREVPIDLTRYNIQLDGPLPRLFLEVEASEANYRIKNVDVRVLSPYKATISQKSITVLVRASAEDLKSLDRSRVFATVDLRGKPKGRHVGIVKVTVPEKIGLVKAVPEKVTVKLH
ncbi:MAG: hypothetical protein A3K03_12445 [Bdellovibrionales bacterium RIFOXYD1_FULL_44_7]|nr:MAG: hypothetical protein A3K03_12445 [Bdellovibrionales bacterium RIFOXYD1_FULL_44_7]